jgi:hypothetical protein
MKSFQLGSGARIALLFAPLLAGPMLGACHDSSATEQVGGLLLLDPEDPSRPLWVDMGEIPLGEVRDKVVKLANHEGRPLLIQQIQAGCSCTSVNLSYVDEHGAKVAGDSRSTTEVLTLPKDAVAELVLHVDSRNAPTKNKDKVVVVRIVSDSATDPYFSFDTHMRVNVAFQAVPPAIDLQRVAADSGGEGSTSLAMIDTRGERLVDVLDAPPGVEAKLTLGYRGGGEVWTLFVQVKPPLALGYFDKPIRLRTTGPDGKGEGHPFDVPLRYFGVADVDVMPAKLLLIRSAPGAPERGETDVFVRLPGARLRIVGHSFVGEHGDKLQVEITAVTPDTQGRSAHWHIALTPQGELGADVISGTLVLETDDTQFPRIEVPWLRRASG